MRPVNDNHPLRRLFAGLVENAFCSEVGICDPQLTDYLADLLVRFTHIDQLDAVRKGSQKRLEQLAAMVALSSDEKKPTTRAQRDCTVYRRIGDYSLFWAGVYPEHLKRARGDKPDLLLDYVSQGKRCYAIVSELTREDSSHAPSLFRHLSDEFEYCTYGLGLVRRGWEKRGDEGGPDTRDIVY